MEYMEAQMQTALEAALEQRRHDATFRRFVDIAVDRAMRHMKHIDSELESRDLHHVAVTAAMTALQLSMESDAVLKQLTAERDHYKKAAEKSLMFGMPTSINPDVPPNEIQFRHADGRIDKLIIPEA